MNEKSFCQDSKQSNSNERTKIYRVLTTCDDDREFFDSQNGSLQKGTRGGQRGITESVSPLSTERFRIFQISNQSTKSVFQPRDLNSLANFKMNENNKNHIQNTKKFYILNSSDQMKSQLEPFSNDTKENFNNNNSSLNYNKEAKNLLIQQDIRASCPFFYQIFSTKNKKNQFQDEDDRRNQTEYNTLATRYDDEDVIPNVQRINTKIRFCSSETENQQQGSLDKKKNTNSSLVNQSNKKKPIDKIINDKNCHIEILENRVNELRYQLNRVIESQQQEERDFQNKIAQYCQQLKSKEIELRNQQKQSVILNEFMEKQLQILNDTEYQIKKRQEQLDQICFQKEQVNQATEKIKYQLASKEKSIKRQELKMDAISQKLEEKSVSAIAFQKELEKQEEQLKEKNQMIEAKLRQLRVAEQNIEMRRKENQEKEQDLKSLLEDLSNRVNEYDREKNIFDEEKQRFDIAIYDFNKSLTNFENQQIRFNQYFSTKENNLMLFQKNIENQQKQYAIKYQQIEERLQQQGDFQLKLMALKMNEEVLSKKFELQYKHLQEEKRKISAMQSELYRKQKN